VRPGAIDILEFDWLFSSGADDPLQSLRTPGAADPSGGWPPSRGGLREEPWASISSAGRTPNLGGRPAPPDRQPARRVLLGYFDDGYARRGAGDRRRRLRRDELPGGVLEVVTHQVPE
jgi:hypothetical protein